MSRRHHFDRHFAEPSAITAGERAHLIAGAANLLGSLTPRQRYNSIEEISTYLTSHPDIFEADLPAVSDEDTLSCPEALAVFDHYLAAVRARVAPTPPTPLDRRIAWAGQMVGLTPLDRAIAGHAARRKVVPHWAKLLESVIGDHSGWVRPRSAAIVLGVTTEAVRARLEHYRPLRMSGLLEDHRDGDFGASDFLIRLARMRVADPHRLAAAMLAPDPRSRLDWEDFAHLGADRTIAAGLIDAAARRREGLNLLFHGLPGTGKTEFARAIADRLGLAAVFIGKADKDGGDPERSDRLAHLTLVRALTARSRGHLVVVDEAEDLMLSVLGKERASSSKLWLNHLVEASSGPTIWIVNDVEALGGPVVRRMSAAIGFPLPPPAVRERVMMRHAAAAGLVFDSGAVKTLGRLTVTPAVAAHGVRAAALTDRSAATVERVAQGLGEALGGRRVPPAPAEPTPFDPALSRTDRDLVALTEALTDHADRRWSLLLEGVPGTGKSAYARHLAERLGIELIERRGSDLLGPYVGQTEAQIAQSFAEAAERGALLLFDEADALLRDRRGAHRGWEVSMVNEMLAWMERHPAPFVATTNLADTLDPATARRFLFRLRFETLDGARAGLLWERHFGDVAPIGLAEIEGLVPSDFALVARRIAITGDAAPERRLAMLAGEVAARPARRRPIGFTTGSGPTLLANDRAA